MSAQYLVGTSGWTYDDWKGSYYPQDLAKSRWFDYYATQFSTVEVNATFYRAFADSTYQKWRTRPPAGFSYVLKVPRLITHQKYLLNSENEIHEFWRSVSLLEDKLGLVLLQVAPQTPYDPNLLRQTIMTFGEPGRVAVEFRSPEWMNVEIRALLMECGATFVSPDSPGQHPVDWVTSQTGYIRLHGRGRWYTYDYSPAELHEIAGLARHMSANGAKKVYIFFNNDYQAHAPKNALALMDILRS
jgi:uncharacterized protein YecE (DUF72 family)